MLDTGLFWYGDNLDVMREYLTGDGEVHLIYLDPPFNSEAAYNMNLREPDGSLSQAQVIAFKDYWRWGKASDKAYDEIRMPRRKYLVPAKLVETMEMLRHILGDCPLMAYLVMMAVRLIEMRRLLHSEGSIFLHCDPTASHYLKLVMDALFTPQCFRNELVWRRTRSHNDKDLSKYGAVHDTILFYSKSEKYLFQTQPQPSNPDKPRSHDIYLHTDGKFYRKDNCNPPGGRGPTYTWNGHTRPWRFSPEERDRLIAEGKIVYSRNGMPRVLRGPIDPDNASVSGGIPLTDTWTDIDAVNPGADEFVGWPTQKPRALLQRIILGSTTEDQVVMDPFCGCGTAVIAAQGLKRKWIGIDITHLAVSILRRRMERDYPGVKSFDVRGEPEDAESARRLAENPLEFQAWVVDKVGGLPIAPEKERKVARGGGDDNRDGYIQFKDDPKKPSKRVLISVKAGESYVNKPEIVDSLGGAMERLGYTLGILLMSHRPSDGAYKRAVGYRTWSSDIYRPDERFDRIRIVTVDDIFDPNWRGIRLPGENTTGKSLPPPGTPGASEELFDATGQPKRPSGPKKATPPPPAPDKSSGQLPMAGGGDFRLTPSKRRKNK